MGFQFLKLWPLGSSNQNYVYGIIDENVLKSGRVSFWYIPANCSTTVILIIYPGSETLLLNTNNPIKQINIYGAAQIFNRFVVGKKKNLKKNVSVLFLWHLAAIPRTWIFNLKKKFHTPIMYYSTARLEMFLSNSQTTWKDTRFLSKLYILNYHILGICKS